MVPHAWSSYGTKNTDIVDSEHPWSSFGFTQACTILIPLGKDHEISNEAGTFNLWMMPSLFMYSLLQCLSRFL
ncbi:hypothetical protein RchiOBHm_Chr1g0327161 [Rosa chinensis]|uniref:Uncharacterized protein n=1 Tax=Rosa chinensis TaxID=74649 RepID=A0A2P6SAI3_ROSCH|nr:hypothetical protein RchiOBHm_Chr1g0327161 [Rosa chinensis]